MNNDVLNAIITFAEIVGICFSAVISISLIVSFIKSDHQENKSTKLSYRDNLVDMINNNFKSIKEYYELDTYASATNRRIVYRIYSKPNWKDVSEIYFDTISVYLKHMPFGFSNLCVDYTLAEYCIDCHGIDNFMSDYNLKMDNINTLYYNNINIGYLGIRKLCSDFYYIDIIEDVGIDRYITISFEYHHNLNDKVLNKIIQKVII